MSTIEQLSLTDLDQDLDIPCEGCEHFSVLPITQDRKPATWISIMEPHDCPSDGLPYLMCEDHKMLEGQCSTCLAEPVVIKPKERI